MIQNAPRAQKLSWAFALSTFWICVCLLNNTVTNNNNNEKKSSIDLYSSRTIHTQPNTYTWTTERKYCELLRQPMISNCNHDIDLIGIEVKDQLIAAVTVLVVNIRDRPTKNSSKAISFYMSSRSVLCWSEE